jgi:tellurite resistance protein TerC
LSGAWICVALAFNVFVYFAYEYHWFGLDLPDDEPDGRTAAVSFLIVAGVALIQRFEWILYLFGAVLLVSGARMALARDGPDPEKNPVIALARRLLPVTHELAGERLAVRIDGKLALTPLALTLIMIETSDLTFAVDSIPAIFAITRDPFLVFTSNIMAVLGLRALYFALAGIIDRFHYLRLALALLLTLIGTKFLLKDILPAWPDTVHYTLAAVTLILGGGIIASLIGARRTPESRHVKIPARRKLLTRRRR